MPIQIQEIIENDACECPLCMEPLEADDINFFPCVCGYQVCRFCWHRIRTDENGLCPACRTSYPENPAEFKPLTGSDLQKIKHKKRQKEVQRRQKLTDNRRHLAAIRVLQKNLVFVVGLSQRLSDPEVLKRQEYFGKFGKIVKVVINNNTAYAGAQGPSSSAYVTYSRMEEALEAIQSVNNVHVDGRTLKASLGTTKYCSTYLKNQQCHKSDCMYLHELAEEEASFTKEEMQAGKHQEVEQKLIEQLMNKEIGLSAEISSINGSEVLDDGDKAADSPTVELSQENPADWLPPSGNDETTADITSSLGERRKPPDQVIFTDVGENSSGHSSHVATPTPPLQLSQPETENNRFPTNEVANVQQTQALRIPSTDLDLNDCLRTDSPSSNPSIDNNSLSQAMQNLQVQNNLMPQHLNSTLHQTQQQQHIFTRFDQNSSTLQSDYPNHILPQSSWPTQQTHQLLTDPTPVKPANDWEAAFGFSKNFTPAQSGASPSPPVAPQRPPTNSPPPNDAGDDDLGFDPWLECNKGLADLLEKECAQSETPAINSFPGAQPNHPLYQPHGNLQNSQFNRMQPHQHSPNSGAANGLPSPGLGGHLFGTGHAMSHMAMHPNLGGFPKHRADSQHTNGANGLSEWKNGLRALLPSVNINFAMDRGASPNEQPAQHLPGYGRIPSTSPSAGSLNRPMGGMLGFGGGQWDGATSHLPSFGAQRTQSAFFQNGSSIAGGADRYSPTVAPPPGLGGPHPPRDPAILSTGSKPPIIPPQHRSMPFEDAPHWLKSIQSLTDFDTPPNNQALSQSQGEISAGNNNSSSGGWPVYNNNSIMPSFSGPSGQQAPPPGFQARHPYTHASDFQMRHSLLENQS